MSTRIMAAVWPLALPSTQKFVLVAIADQANDEGYCWPSLGSIAERTGLSDRAVRNALRSLEDAGLLGTAHRGNKSSIYQVIIPSDGGEQAEPRSAHTDVPEIPTGGNSVPPGTTCRPEPRSGQAEPRSGQAEPRSGQAEPRSADPLLNHQDPSPNPRAQARVRAGDGFQRFWTAYPKKAKRRAAEAAWAALAPSPELEATILTAVERQASTTGWRREGGRYAPAPADWLRDERWTDGPTPPIAADGSIFDIAGEQVWVPPNAPVYDAQIMALCERFAVASRGKDRPTLRADLIAAVEREAARA